ncbi:MAG: glutathione peroxidase [Porticoccus sp.]|jgi:glutathione peroxidase
MTTAYDFTLPKLKGGDLPLQDYKGKVVLLVNVASQCGLTPQYSKLQELQEQYTDKGLVVLGVPCNQFRGQESGNDEEIATFCDTQYGISFPMASKVDVNGDNSHPLYQWLTKEGTEFGGNIEWNFGKFIINRYGDPVNRFNPKTEPDAPEVIQAIENCL